MAQQMVQSIPVPTYTGVGDIEGYIERLECYFELMKTRTESRVPLLLCGLTAGQYQTLRDLVAPEVPKEVAYDTLKGRLIEHYGSVRNTRLEKAKFRALRRDEKESVADFEVRLRNAVRYCEFTGEILNENLVEQFISGINHPGIERKLLQKGSSLKLSEAVQEASAFLLLDAKSGREGQSDTPVSVSAISKGNAVVCFRCGKRGHVARDKSCKAVGKKCNDCGVVGHFAKSKFCRLVRPENNSQSSRVRNGSRSRRGGRANQITDEHADTKQEKAVTHLFSVEVRNVKEAPTCEAEIRGQQCHASLETEIKSKFTQCFDGEGKLKGTKVKIHVDPDREPVAQPVRRLPFGYRDKVATLLERLEAEDIIESVEGVGSRWVSPIVVVPKSDGDLRMCIDFRKVNEAIIRERYTIPTMQEMLAALNGSKVFSKLDLKQGFFQLELDKESREITTFVTHVGLFRMKRLGMGISCAPELFQYTIQKVLAGLPGVLNLADDIVVFGKDERQHKERLLSVMSRLSESGLTLNPGKCQFGLSSITFLGHVISDNGVSADPGKVEAIVNARAPMNVSELRGFLGLVQYVGRYIPDLATLSAPLRALTRKSVPFEWTQKQEDSFRDIKRLMSASETLAYFDRESETTVIADASPVGLGAVLVQRKAGENRVVAYGHRSLTDVEKRYSQTEREALSLVWACEHFQMYLLGTKFKLITDHKPLTHVFNNANSKSTPRLERWSLRLEPFDFELQYKPGESNIADPMSRLSRGPRESTKVDDTGDYIAAVVREAIPIAMSWEEIKTSSDNCDSVENMKEALKTGKWDKCAASVKSVRGELSECDGVILRGNRIFIPSDLRDRVLKLAHEGHQGIVKCKQRLRSKVWWLGMDKDVEFMCKSCELCQLVSSYDPPVPIVTTEMPKGPWQFCSTDLLGPLPDGRYVIVIIDYFSRYFEAAMLRSTKAENIIEFLDATFARYGYPEVLRTDNGPQFISGEFQTFLRAGGVKWLSTTPLWPQANGLVERTNRSILKVLKIATQEKADMQREFRKFVAAYRSTPHAGTGCTPFSLMFGREMRTKLPQLDFTASDPELARDRDREYKLKLKKHADKKAKESEIKEGDTVLMRNEQQGKLEPNFRPEKYKVVSKNGSDIVCESETGGTLRRNVQCAKKVPEATSEEVSKENQGNPELIQDPIESNPPVDQPPEPPSIRTSVRARQPPARLNDYLVYQ
ncbi:uncharacterized protein K02A2.6-like [Nematostella vectensis]|uniref:uncharacterized protein K02A2.6-like n=1 Tax=Nematostella vectensis TaxID=45351 RepID=UPI0020777F37|nr:uncharacterized protein K02A2.6-like [Nematostella vectensis]